MNPRNELRQYMKAIDERAEGSGDEHPRAEELRAYVEGSLAEKGMRAVEGHVAGCALCAEELRDLKDFFEPIREGEREVSELEIAQAWRSVGSRIDRGRSRSWASVAGSPFALAASLLLAVALGVASIRMEGRNRDLESRLTGRESRLEELESEVERLQATSSRLEGELARLRSPQPNALVVDLFSRAWAQRSGGDVAPAEIVVPPEAERFVVILAGEGWKPSDDHVLEIVDDRGERIWRAEGLKPDGQGSFVVAFERSFLSGGSYRFLLLARRGSDLVQLAEYPFRVTYR
jgi:hypothetical protein